MKPTMDKSETLVNSPIGIHELNVLGLFSPATWMWSLTEEGITRLWSCQGLTWPSSSLLIDASDLLILISQQRLRELQEGRNEICAACRCFDLDIGGMVFPGDYEWREPDTERTLHRCGSKKELGRSCSFLPLRTISFLCNFHACVLLVQLYWIFLRSAKL